MNEWINQSMSNQFKKNRKHEWTNDQMNTPVEVAELMLVMKLTHRQMNKRVNGMMNDQWKQMDKRIAAKLQKTYYFKLKILHTLARLNPQRQYVAAQVAPTSHVFFKNIATSIFVKIWRAKDFRVARQVDLDTDIT